MVIRGTALQVPISTFLYIVGVSLHFSVAAFNGIELYLKICHPSHQIR